MYRFRLLAIFKIRLSRDMPWLRHGRKVHGKPFFNYRSPRGSIVGLQLFRSFKFRWPRRNPEADRTTSNVTDTPKGVSKGKTNFPNDLRQEISVTLKEGQFWSICEDQKHFKPRYIPSAHPSVGSTRSAKWMFSLQTFIRGRPLGMEKAIKLFIFLSRFELDFSLVKDALWMALSYISPNFSFD